MVEISIAVGGRRPGNRINRFESTKQKVEAGVTPEDGRDGFRAEARRDGDLETRRSGELPAGMRLDI